MAILQDVHDSFANERQNKLFSRGHAATPKTTHNKNEDKKPSKQWSSELMMFTDLSDGWSRTSASQSQTSYFAPNLSVSRWRNWRVPRGWHRAYEVQFSCITLHVLVQSKPICAVDVCVFKTFTALQIFIQSMCSRVPHHIGTARHRKLRELISRSGPAHTHTKHLNSPITHALFTAMYINSITQLHLGHTRHGNPRLKFSGTKLIRTYRT